MITSGYTFTGQFAYDAANELGLMFYRARFYDNSLGRFISADNILPSAYEPPSYDRYAYVRSNPLKYVDPSGHNWRCGPDGLFCQSDFTLKSLFTCKDCSKMDQAVVSAGVQATASALGSVMKLSPAAAFWTIYGFVTFARVKSYSYLGKSYDSGAVTWSANLVEFASLEYEGISNFAMALLRGANQIIHELGHAFSHSATGANAYSALKGDMNWNPLLRRDDPREGYSYGFASGYTHYLYQFSDSLASSANEIFADMFVGYVTGDWFTGSFPLGWGGDMGKNTQIHIDMANEKSNWMNRYMDNLLGRP